MKTDKNLKEAFAGESQANRRYLAFAQKAEADGFTQVSRLFKAAAEAETVHALAHLAAMDGIKSTEANLKEAVAGETHEFTKMYPAMIEDAKEESHQAALSSFFRANKVEEIHAGLFNKALGAVKSGKDLKQNDIYVCEVCGNTVEGDAPDVCPICGAKREKFKKIM